VTRPTLPHYTPPDMENSIWTTIHPPDMENSIWTIYYAYLFSSNHKWNQTSSKHPLLCLTPLHWLAFRLLMVQTLWIAQLYGSLHPPNIETGIGTILYLFIRTTRGSKRHQKFLSSKVCNFQNSCKLANPNPTRNQLFNHPNTFHML
jgi:hypothetical protein